MNEAYSQSWKSNEQFFLLQRFLEIFSGTVKVLTERLERLTASSSFIFFTNRKKKKKKDFLFGARKYNRLSYLGRELSAEAFAKEDGVFEHEIAKTVLNTVCEYRFHGSLFWLDWEKNKKEIYIYIYRERERGFLVFWGFL